jgi:hypothetical protein
MVDNLEAAKRKNLRLGWDLAQERWQKVLGDKDRLSVKKKPAASPPDLLSDLFYFHF